MVFRAGNFRGNEKLSKIYMDRVTVLRETLAVAVGRWVAMDVMSLSLLLLVLWPGTFLHYIVLGSQRREVSMSVGSR